MYMYYPLRSVELNLLLQHLHLAISSSDKTEYLFEINFSIFFYSSYWRLALKFFIFEYSRLSFHCLTKLCLYTLARSDATMYLLQIFSFFSASEHSFHIIKVNLSCL